jgi:hypothetical protein
MYVKMEFRMDHGLEKARLEDRSKEACDESGSVAAARWSLH